MKKKVLATILAGAMVLGTMTGCGSAGTDSTGSTVTSDNKTAQADVADTSETKDTQTAETEAESEATEETSDAGLENIDVDTLDANGTHYILKVDWDTNEVTALSDRGYFGTGNLGKSAVGEDIKFYSNKEPVSYTMSDDFAEIAKKSVEKYESERGKLNRFNDEEEIAKDNCTIEEFAELFAFGYLYTEDPELFKVEYTQVSDMVGGYDGTCNYYDSEEDIKAADTNGDGIITFKEYFPRFVETGNNFSHINNITVLD